MCFFATPFFKIKKTESTKLQLRTGNSPAMKIDSPSLICTLLPPSPRRLFQVTMVVSSHGVRMPLRYQKLLLIN